MSDSHPAESHITPGHVRAFQAVTSRLYDNITLWSCRIDGEPGVAIVMVDRPTPSTIAVMPLFVAITDKMEIVFDGEAQGGGGGGGPKSSRERFEAAQQDATTPAPS